MAGCTATTVPGPRGPRPAALTAATSTRWSRAPCRVIVASRGGDDHHPAWFLNLQADPAVEVRLKGRPAQPMHAHVATAEERDRLWPQITAKYKNYAGYQDKTQRQIPLVLLKPNA